MNEQINGPDIHTLHVFVYSNLSQATVHEMQKLTTKYGLQNDDVSGVIQQLQKRNSRTASENKFMSLIQSSFEFEKVDYNERCIISCNNL